MMVVGAQVMVASIEMMIHASHGDPGADTG